MTLNEKQSASGVAACSPVQIKKRRLFALYFFILIIASFLAGYALPASVESLLRGWTSSAAVLMARLLGLEAFTEPSFIISIEGQRLSVVTECSAISYIFIYISAVFAYPSGLAKKIHGLVFGIPLIVMLNISRIVSLGWIGGHIPEYFDLFHTVLWEGGFVAITFFVWMAWLNDCFELTRPGQASGGGQMSKGYLPFRAAVLFLIILFFTFAGTIYQFMLASISEFLAGMLTEGAFAIRAEGNVMVIAFSAGNFKEFWAGQSYLLPLLVLFLIFPAGLGSMKGNNLRTGFLFLRLALGLLFITLLQVFCIVIFFMLMEREMSGWPMAAVDTLARLSPIIVWAFTSLPQGKLFKGFNQTQ